MNECAPLVRFNPKACGRFELFGKCFQVCHVAQVQNLAMLWKELCQPQNRIFPMFKGHNISCIGDGLWRDPNTMHLYLAMPMTLALSGFINDGFTTGWRKGVAISIVRAIEGLIHQNVGIDPGGS